jgi:16S rRNA (guanine527-N7)-methyltransferase
MNKDALEEDFRRFRDHLNTSGPVLDQDSMARVREYGLAIARRSETLNLVARGDRTRLFTRHIRECLFSPLVGLASREGTLVDIGSGAGLPGVPLALACKELQVSLVESRLRKAQFLEAIVAALGLAARVHVFHGTAERLSRQPGRRPEAGLATARAVADTSTVWHWCQPLLRPGGWLATFKDGRDALAEAGRLKDPPPASIRMSPLPWAPRALLLLQKP